MTELFICLTDEEALRVRDALKIMVKAIDDLREVTK
jgi:hypothetical protein